MHRRGEVPPSSKGDDGPTPPLGGGTELWTNVERLPARRPALA